MTMIKMIVPVLGLLALAVDTLFKGEYMKVELIMMKYPDIVMSLETDKWTVYFLLMVTVVTVFILAYSTFYFESYNKKKMIALTAMFFLSMVILSLSSGFVTTMLGWDALGISSYCLVMMYQSKKTVSNSLMVMAFNRLGDVLMILALILSSKMTCSMTFSQSVNNYWPGLILFLGAAMTKSAQFPLSGWLPAAMSAPTPISAMVHSSTLVTAGVYVVIKVLKSLEKAEMSWILTTISSVTMVGAGLFMLYEKNMKKVVAFSTMMHISLIMVMLSIGMKEIALAHMMAHALFKSSMFMAVGSRFIGKYGAEDVVGIVLLSISNKSHFKLGCFMLSAIPFTASFYTKDLTAEILCFEPCNSTGGLWEIFMIATLLTIWYVLKIIQALTDNKEWSKASYNKKPMESSTIVLGMLMMVSSKVMFELANFKVTAYLSKGELILPIVVMMLGSCCKTPKSKVLSFCMSEMFGQISMTVNKGKKVMTSINMNYDSITMSKKLWSVEKSWGSSKKI